MEILTTDVIGFEPFSNGGNCYGNEFGAGGQSGSLGGFPLPIPFPPMGRP